MGVSLSSLPLRRSQVLRAKARRAEGSQEDSQILDAPFIGTPYSN